MDAMTRAYLTCALWSSNDESDPSGGNPLDKNYDLADIAPESVTKAENDCRAFREQMGDALMVEYQDRALSDETELGHDFWLTRNGHGAGFWDRGLGELGDRLSKLAHSFGECDAYVGDDGRIYLS